MSSHRRPIHALWLCFLSFSVGQASLQQNASRADVDKSAYDFIVVGGGTAGNVVANRLSENPKFNVLVLEAGQDNEDAALELQIPFLCNRLAPNTPYDWNYTTVPQKGLGGRAIPYPRGHVLGGSSSINYLAYTRGTSEDYDRFAKVSGDDGWSWKNLQQYFKKNEMFNPPVDNHNTTGQFNPLVHGFNGVNSVSLSGFPSPIDGRIIQTTNELGGGFKFNLDMNSGNSLGLGWKQATTKGPRRSSSATSYLAPEVRKRPNLHILVGAQVSRLIQTGTESGTPVFRGVEYRLSSGGSLQNVIATKEVILSAGSIGSPHILLNSGIGDAKSLNALGIKPIVDLPDIGENLVDHPLNSIAFTVNSTDTFDRVNRDPAILAQEIELWNTTGTGLLVDTTASHIAFLRVPKNNAALKALPMDPAAGPNTPHYELIFANGKSSGKLPAEGFFASITTAVVQPSSRGTVKLRSNNPFDAPLIDPALLSTDFDRAAMREAIRSGFQFFGASVWKDYIIAPVGISNNSSDAEIDAYNVAASGTVFHPVGTASVSPRNAKGGAVDPDLKLKKVVGVRVVDLSVLPFITSGHTQTPAYIIGERASDLIKASHS